MSGPGLTREQVREVDRIAMREFGIPGAVLMENAGLLSALEIHGDLGGRSGPVEVLCGGGNNGGDGFVVARQLVCRGHRVRLWVTRGAEQLAGDAALQRRIVGEMGIDLRDLREPGVLEGAAGSWRAAAALVDGLLGTGFRGEVRSPELEVISSLPGPGEGPRIYALDVPSGLDVDTGQAGARAVRADTTLTFVASKVGFDARGASAYTGEVRVLPIGAPDEAVRMARERFPSG